MQLQLHCLVLILQQLNITDDSPATTSVLLKLLTINSISVANTLADLQIDGVLTPTVNSYW